MQLTERTQAVLSNFAKINSGIVLFPGNVIRTVSTGKTNGGEASIDVEIPREVPIYDVVDFLNVASLLKEPQIDFQDGHMVIHSGNHKQIYHYSAKETIVYKDVPFAHKEMFTSFKLSKSDLATIMKAVGVVRGTHITFENKPGKGLRIYAAEVSRSDGSVKAKFNTFTIEVDDYECDVPYTYVIDKNFMTMIPMDYEVSLHGAAKSKLVTFKNDEAGLVYHVSVESVSKKG